LKKLLLLPGLLLLIACQPSLEDLENKIPFHSNAQKYSRADIQHLWNETKLFPALDSLSNGQLHYFDYPVRIINFNQEDMPVFCNDPIGYAIQFRDEETIVWKFTMDKNSSDLRWKLEHGQVITGWRINHHKQ